MAAIRKVNRPRLDFTALAIQGKKIGFGKAKRGYAFTTAAEHKIGLDVKEKLCYIALDFDTEMKEASESSDKEKTCKRPDGNIITVGSKRFRCPEVLFQPNFICKEASGIHDTTSRLS